MINTRNAGLLLGLGVLGTLAIAPASAQTIYTQFNFNNSTTNPNIGAGTVALLGTTATFAGGSPNDLAATDFAYNTTSYPTQGTGSGTEGIRFNVSTVGQNFVAVSYDQRFSNTSSRFASFEYSTNGTTFTPFATYENTLGGDAWLSRNFDLSNISGVANNANFAFRVVSVFQPTTSAYLASNPASSYATTGTLRFDLVTAQTPAPSSVAVMALGGLMPLVAIARRRRAAK